MELLAASNLSVMVGFLIACAPGGWNKVVTLWSVFYLTRDSGLCASKDDQKAMDYL
jgi:hypothetical protein